ncbi:MAG: NAD(P)-dependent oxidoreductase [Candidatus Cloacimonadaceae bacterium]|nr:NAD(P)-dependent oxidoreductase [Candidatus Cloacimonadota bacterium]MCK9242628.1 NAD(P)-dependent oxidoreductase [Candidatus Cloacimonadota bacterium]MDY0127146.1 NAD(P)-dependent oxidoreductase [Candidatus Cloacimonadaceae bacterium]
MAKLLITGITGFVGFAVLRKIINEGHDITALLRPKTEAKRYQEFSDKVTFKELSLSDTAGLRDYLQSSDFDTIMHIGALRGGRKASQEEYYRSNVSSTEQMVDYCLKHDARLIFCSSVGVYGAIPNELPANYQSQKNPDNYYHYTKIEAEKIIGKAILHGLKAAIIRPSITYGKGDHGFPYQLVKLVARYQFPLINKRIWIHLCHIDALVLAFKLCLGKGFESGLVWNVADREPVQLSALVNFISRQLHKKNYPSLLKVDRVFFSFGEKLSRLCKNELFISRFELISKSWFYDVQGYYKAIEKLGQKPHFTIPGIQITIDDYLGK